MLTYFAPAERAPYGELLEEFSFLRSFELLNNTINSIPYIVLILNNQRQLVLTNQYFIDLLGANNLNELIGKRPGELINCNHAFETSGGCGTTKYCKYCGAVNAIIQCIETGRRTDGECRILVDSKNKENLAYDFHVTASPFRIEEKNYIVLTFTDISSEKRRNVLENIFLHDILNTVGALHGLLEFLNEFPNDLERNELMKLALNLSHQVIDEIIAQRELIAAEQGELKPKFETVYCCQVIENVKKQIERHPVAKDKRIKMVSPNINFAIDTDQVLLRRILVNMLKNALEASVAGQEVSIGYSVNLKNNCVTFFVHNEFEIPIEIKAQIFQRSFSTKGSSRGLGTYSIKLLGEIYLKGKVYFTSTNKEGTTFYIDLPQKN